MCGVTAQLAGGVQAAVRVPLVAVSIAGVAACAVVLPCGVAGGTVCTAGGTELVAGVVAIVNCVAVRLTRVAVSVAWVAVCVWCCCLAM